MSNNAEDTKGRLKEAAGSLTGDDQLKNEGKADQASAAVKDKIDDAKGLVEDGVDKVKNILKRD